MTSAPILDGAPPPSGMTNTAEPGTLATPTPWPVQYASLDPSGKKRGRRPSVTIRRAGPPRAGTRLHVGGPDLNQLEPDRELAEGGRPPSEGGLRRVTALSVADARPERGTRPTPTCARIGRQGYAQLAYPHRTGDRLSGREVFLIATSQQRVLMGSPYRSPVAQRKRSSRRYGEDSCRAHP